MKHLSRPLTSVACVAASLWRFGACAPAAPAGPAPYPPSPVIAGIAFDHDTLVIAAPGSDQFGTTWASDGNLYAAWGDGGGFGGTNSEGRASLGVARLEGVPPEWRGLNIWGGVDPVSGQHAILGKTSSGVVAVDQGVYLYVLEQGVWTSNHLWRTTDLGMSWEDLGQVFKEEDGAFAEFGVIQFGPGYQGGRDGYVYGYGVKPWPDGLGLSRVRRSRLADRAAYEFFAGRDGAGHPIWTSDIRAQEPAFSDPAGIGWGVTCVFHPVLRRYLLAVRHNGDSGEWGLFDAPEPWGPWTTVAYGADLPAWTYTPDPNGASRNRPAWMHTFPAKWISEDGTTMWHISDRGDSFNLVRATLRLR
jgi:hypothetical protein